MTCSHRGTATTPVCGGAENLAFSPTVKPFLVFDRHIDANELRQRSLDRPSFLGWLRCFRGNFDCIHDVLHVGSMFAETKVDDARLFFWRPVDCLIDS
jgi:hypothetical protein